MAVVIETTLGDIAVDLYLEQRPVTCLNFLKLCKMKYYNYNLFHSIRSGFIAQTGDPTGEGSGGQSIWGILEGPQKRFFSGEKMPKIRHTEAGLLSMVCTDDMMVGSQFFLTLASDLDSLDGTHCVIGEVTEGHEVLRKLNEVICDESHRPYRDVRITHTVVLEDPFNDPAGLRAPSRSPSPNPQRLMGGRIAPDEDIDETEGKTTEEIQEMIEEKEAKARATILEIVGDLPDADIAPPENVLFVCKLNPVTTDDDLEIIFSRFGKIVSCEVIRDKKTGNSLQYAFIEFDNKKSCEDAYFKMDNVLIDDRRIHVDFSQSVSKMRWLGKGRGVQYFNDDKSDTSFDRKDKSKSPESRDKHKHKSKDDNSKRDDKKYERNESRYNDRRQKSDRHENNDKSQRERSRSRSRLEDSRSHKRDRESRRQSKDRDNRESRDYKRHRSDHNGIEKSKSISNSSHKKSDRRNNSSSPKRRREAESSDKRDRYERNEDNHSKRGNGKDERKKEHSNVVSKTKNKSNVYDEPKTPSPILNKKRDKNKGKSKNKQIKEIKPKKKRKVSTSSSDSSSESSSSTESSSSSSSESDRKKKRIKRKRRKSSTSCSSSSSSSSSEDSSDTSTSSSDSEADKKKRKTKVRSKRTLKKSKK